MNELEFGCRLKNQQLILYRFCVWFRDIPEKRNWQPTHIVLV